MGFELGAVMTLTSLTLTLTLTLALTLSPTSTLWELDCVAPFETGGSVVGLFGLGLVLGSGFGVRGSGYG